MGDGTNGDPTISDLLGDDSFPPEKPKRKEKSKNDSDESGCSCVGIFSGCFGLFVIMVMIVLGINFVRISLSPEVQTFIRQAEEMPFDETTGIKAYGQLLEQSDRGIRINMEIRGQNGPVRLAPNDWMLELVTEPDMKYIAYTSHDDHDLGILNHESTLGTTHTFSSIFTFTSTSEFDYTFYFAGPNILQVAETLRVFLLVRNSDGVFDRQEVSMLVRTVFD